MLTLIGRFFGYEFYVFPDIYSDKLYPYYSFKKAKRSLIEKIISFILIILVTIIAKRNKNKKEIY